MPAPLIDPPSVDAARAAALVAEAFPELRGLDVHPFGRGYDNSAFLVEERWVFRFPKRAGSVECLQREIEVLPALASLLPVAVSAPRFVALSGEGFPFPFAGYELVPGGPAHLRAFEPASASVFAASVGRFLRALHGVRHQAGGGAPPLDALGKTDPPRALRALRLRLRRMRREGAELDVDRVLELARAWCSEPLAESARAWVHGDLYPKHALVDADGRLSGVIDWGDLHGGDPAQDLSLAFGWLDPDAGAALLEAYGPVDDATRDRARFRALYYGVVLSDFGAQIGDEELVAIGRSYLARTLA